MTKVSTASAETTRKTRKSTSKVASDKPQELNPNDVIVPVEPEAELVAAPRPTKKPTQKPAPSLKPEDFVVVRNGFNGRLVYRSRNTGETYTWDAFGSEQEIELRELKRARNSSKAFFINNWFMFDDPAVIDWLGVGMFYKNTLGIDKLDELFSMPPADIEQTIRLLPKGQKETVANRARELVKQGGVIDSVRVIEALERSLGITLIQR